MDETSSWMMGKLSDDPFTYENGSNHASGEDDEEDCGQYGVKQFHHVFCQQEKNQISILPNEIEHFRMGAIFGDFI